MSKSHRIASIFIAIIFILAGCNSITQPSSPAPMFVQRPEFPVTVNGVLFDKAVGKAAILSPMITEWMFDFGFDDNVKVISDNTDYPEHTSVIPSAGTTFNVNTEILIDLEIELVISQSDLPSAAKQKLLDGNIKLLIMDRPTNFTELADCYRKLHIIFEGGTTGKRNGNEYIREYMTSIYNISKSAKDSDNPVKGTKVCYLLSHEPFVAATGDSLEAQYLRRLKVDNVAFEETGYGLTMGQLSELEPSHLILGEGADLDSILADIEFNRLSAVYYESFIDLREYPIERFSKRSVIGLEIIAETFASDR